MCDKNEMFIEGLEGFEYQAEINTYVGRCLGEKHGRKETMKEETKGTEVRRTGI